MYSDRDNAALPALGFPIRRSTGQRLLNAYPWLIAVVHVLHRLLMPRHPPCALTILTVIQKNSEDITPSELGDLPTPGANPRRLFGQLCSFQGPTERAPEGFSGSSARARRRASMQRSRPAAGLSKLNSMCAQTTSASYRSGRHTRNACWP